MATSPVPGTSRVIARRPRRRPFGTRSTTAESIPPVSCRTASGWSSSRAVRTTCVAGRRPRRRLSRGTAPARRLLRPERARPRDPGVRRLRVELVDTSEQRALTELPSEQRLGPDRSRVERRGATCPGSNRQELDSTGGASGPDGVWNRCWKPTESATIVTPWSLPAATAPNGGRNRVSATGSDCIR